MALNCGIIGLPNVGKSTIFNALSGANAQMANYPFCTIEPNKGTVEVPDERLLKIADLLAKKNPINTKIEFVDLAGLVKGASKGEGLGNKFLGNIRNVDALIHIVRCFRNADVAHVTGDTDPVEDIEIINTELCLADLEILERAREKILRIARSGNKNAKTKTDILEKCIDHLNHVRPLKELKIDEYELGAVIEYNLITLKPVLYIANNDEESKDKDLAEKVQEYAENEGSVFLSIYGKLEEEISELANDEKQDYLDLLGIGESALGRLIKSAYKLLNLITFYTTATDLQAWTLVDGMNSQGAAGKIHTDFEKGFIRAEVFGFGDLVKAGSLQRVKETGLLRIEGKEYIVSDGDIIHFLFNL